MDDGAGGGPLILVLERDMAYPARIAVRAVLEEGELAPVSLLDYRVLLRRALADLPGDVKSILVCPFPQRRKDDRGRIP